MNVYLKNIMEQFDDSDYILALSISPELAIKVNHFKNELSFMNQSEAEDNSYILLSKFNHFNHLEQQLLHKLTLIAQYIKPFVIDIAGFNFVPSHSIYFNIEQSTALRHFTSLIKKEIKPMLKSNTDNKPLFMDLPQLVLANKLKTWQYEQAWNKMGQLNFTGRFVAYDFVLLKNSEDKGYQFIKTYTFSGNNIKAVQTSLF